MTAGVRTGDAAGAPLAMTMGDPAGIGPEIALKILADARPFGRGVAVYGDVAVLRATAERLGAAVRVEEAASPRDAAEETRAAGAIGVVATSALAQPPALGAVSAQAGRAAFDAIAEAISDARGGGVAGLVTAPINKAALAAARIGYPGHTEMLADLGGVERVAMMLINDDIRTVLVTIHMSLADAIVACRSRAAQREAIRLADQGARAFGVAAPRVAVAGLNPHAGEDGLFGREEIEVIAPAVAEARAAGIDASGPWPGDTVFLQAREGRFDVVVAQYHDQGLIPVKYLGLERGVNVTLGLPFVRTSPDHGTAFDIAGRGVADPRSLAAALEAAERLADARGL